VTRTPSPYRHLLAAIIALTLALYATVFARQTHNTYDLPTWIDITEWPVTLLFLAAAWAAWRRVPRRAALLLVTGMIAFLGVQGRYLFEVPLGFVLVTALSLAFLFTLPSAWER
jgi:hypothetical protein